MKKLLFLLILTLPNVKILGQTVAENAPSKPVYSLGLSVGLGHTALKFETVSPYIFTGFGTPLQLTYRRNKAVSRQSVELGYQSQTLKSPFGFKVVERGFTYSTANNFTLMMRVLPNVQTLGNTTGDGVFGQISREMPNGWLLQFPSGLAFLPDKTVVEGSGGLVPKIVVTISEADKQAGRDAILEKALMLLK